MRDSVKLHHWKFARSRQINEFQFLWAGHIHSPAPLPFMKPFDLGRDSSIRSRYAKNHRALFKALFVDIIRRCAHRRISAELTARHTKRDVTILCLGQKADLLGFRHKLHEL